MKTMIGKGVAKGTWTNFNTTYNHVSAFLATQYDVNEINILSLDLEFVKTLYRWFRTVKNLGHNSALKNIANLKKIVISCVDNGWLQVDPFLKFDLSREEVQTSFLVKEEIQAIADKVIKNTRLSRVRDVFIFCCFTGLAFADVKQLKKSEVAIGVDGNLRIYKGRQKTGTPSIIPLLPITQKILSKYKNDEKCIKNDQLLPVLTNHRRNMDLKPTTIQLLGHATFKIVTPEGRTIIIDPWLIDNPYIPEPFKVQKDIDLILITHGHEDHMDFKIAEILLRNNAMVVANNVCRWFLIEKGVNENRFEPMNLGGTIKLLDVKVSMVNAFHHSHVYLTDSTITYPHAANGFVVKMSDDTTVYFAGDTCVFGDMKIISAIYKPNIAVIPIGNRSMMGPMEAAYALQLLGVKNAIPFHYGTFKQFTQEPDEFIELAKESGDYVIHVLKAGEILDCGKILQR